VLVPEHVDTPVHKRPATRYAEELAQSVAVHGSSDCQQALLRRGLGSATSAYRLTVVVEFDEMTRLVQRGTEEIEETVCLPKQPNAMSGRPQPRVRGAGVRRAVET
jgi:hypothetical protein